MQIDMYQLIYIVFINCILIYCHIGVASRRTRHPDMIFGEKKEKGEEPDNPSPKGCFVSIALVASRTTQINVVDSWFTPACRYRKL